MTFGKKIKFSIEINSATRCKTIYCHTGWSSNKSDRTILTRRAAGLQIRGLWHYYNEQTVVPPYPRKILNYMWAVVSDTNQAKYLGIKLTQKFDSRLTASRTCSPTTLMRVAFSILYNVYTPSPNLKNLWKNIKSLLTISMCDKPRYWTPTFSQRCLRWMENYPTETMFGYLKNRLPWRIRRRFIS